MIDMDVYDNMHPDERRELNDWLREIGMHDQGPVGIELTEGGVCRFTCVDRDATRQLKTGDLVLVTVDKPGGTVPEVVSRWGAGKTPPALTAVAELRDERVAVERAEAQVVLEAQAAELGIEAPALTID